MMTHILTPHRCSFSSWVYILLTFVLMSYVISCVNMVFTFVELHRLPCIHGSALSDMPCISILLDLIPRWGWALAKNKLVAPATAVTCLGILIDTQSQTISIQKLHEIVQICKSWTPKNSNTKS